MDDSVTPLSLRMQRNTLIHVVRNVSSRLLCEAINDAGLTVNCPYCHTAGALLELRPLCGTCSFEGVCLLSDFSIRKGRTTWGELEGKECMCFKCMETSEGGSCRPVAWGMKCTALSRVRENCVCARGRVVLCACPVPSRCTTPWITGWEALYQHSS